MARTAYTRRQELPQRDRHFLNAPTWVRYQHDEVNTYPYDISNNLDSGETASSLSIKDRLGVTVDSSSVTAAGVISVTISKGAEGSLTAEVTTSAGRKLPFPMQWRSPNPIVQDYYRYRY